LRTRQALDYVMRCAQETDLQKAIDDFLSTIAVFGFTACAAGSWSGFGPARVSRFYFNSWPQSWMELYQNRSFFLHDPYPLQAARRMSPFLFTEEETFLRRMSPQADEIIDAAMEYGWREIFGVPIHGPGGYQALISMASMTDLSLSPRERAGLQAMAHAIHDRCHKTEGFGLRSKPQPKFSERELECMRWVAMGKSDAEIGLILGLSGATAHFHVEKVKKKLDTRSRTEAVALLILDGLL
jgi:DNA-binding CsgD family transcriptional regulator